MSAIPEYIKCLIIGSGPAGYTAAVYAARAGLQPVMYTGMLPGGQLTQTTEVENFPGYPQGILGPDMMEDLRQQALRFGTEIRTGYVTAVDFSGHPHKVIIDDEVTVLADTVIISTGASAKWPGLESELKYQGSGVSGCAVCDGYFFKGRDVAIGHHPNTEVFRGWVPMDSEGYIQTIPGSTQTGIPGIFCAGDAQDRHYRQAITAAGTGCMAALDAERYLTSKDIETWKQLQSRL
jgi:thioredoxin reductase